MDFATVAAQFDKPINEASRELGLCTTLLKKQCRRYGIVRWPYRKLRSIDARLEALRAEDPVEQEKNAAIFQDLLMQRQRILSPPESVENKSQTGSKTQKKSQEKTKPRWNLRRRPSNGEFSDSDFSISEGSGDDYRESEITRRSKRNRHGESTLSEDISILAAPAAVPAPPPASTTDSKLEVTCPANIPVPPCDQLPAYAPYPQGSAAAVALPQRSVALQMQQEVQPTTQITPVVSPVAPPAPAAPKQLQASCYSFAPAVWYSNQPYDDMYFNPQMMMYPLPPPNIQGFDWLNLPEMS